MLSRNHIEQLCSNREEPEWLRSVRLASWKLFEGTKWADPPDAPLLKHYTSLHELDISRFDGPGACKTAGTCTGGNGVIFCPLAQAAREHRELVEPRLGAIVPPSEDRFSCLNMALWEAGHFVHVPPGACARIVRFGASFDGGAGFARNMVVVEAGAAAEVVEMSASTEGDKLVTEVTEVFLGPGARLDYYFIYEHGSGTARVCLKRARCSAGAEMNWHGLELGGGLSKIRVDSVFMGESARGVNLGCFVARGNRHLDYSANVKHEGGKNEHDIVGRGVVTDDATVVHRGLIDIGERASQSNSNFASRILSLGGRARANSLPTLVIRTNDVRAKHSTSVGQMDEEQLFYMASRGIPADEAREMILRGFFEPVLRRIPNPRIQTEFRFTLGRALQCGREVVEHA